MIACCSDGTRPVIFKIERMMRWRKIKMIRILLCCAGGMSTSLLVTKMEQAAQEKGIETKIWAVGATEVKITAKMQMLFF